MKTKNARKMKMNWKIAGLKVTAEVSSANSA
jgi:hypothetical protein